MYRGNFFRAYGFWHWGEGFQTSLFTWYMAFHADLSATEIGFYQALVLSPVLFFTMIGGAITDKIGARLSYCLSTALFAGVLIGYGLLDHAFGFVPILFFGYCILAGIVSAVSNPAIDTFIPEATSEPVQRNGLLAATAHNVAKLSGNLTGLFIPILSAMGGFILNSILMMLSVVFLYKHASPKSDQTHMKSVQKETRKTGGFAVVFRHFHETPESLDIWLSSVMLGLVMVPVGYILLPLVLREYFPEYGDWIAVLGVCSWIGAITVSITAERLSHKIKYPGRWALAIWGAWGVIILSLIFVWSFVSLCFLVAIFGMTMVGKALIYGRYLNNVPVEHRGVMVAIDQAAFWGVATGGTFGLGALVDLVGLQLTIVLTSGVILFCVFMLTMRGNLWRMVQQG